MIPLRKTKTIAQRVPLRPDPGEPVLLLWMAREKRSVDLAELFGLRRRLAVGAHAKANFRIDKDPHVSGDHCLWHYEKQCFFVRCSGAKNRTLVNLAACEPHTFIELRPGALLTLGTTHFLACGLAREEQEPDLLPSLDTLIERADYYHGPVREAGRRIGMNYRTFARRLSALKERKRLNEDQRHGDV